MGGISDPKLVRTNSNMIHLCQAEIEMLVLAASVLNDTIINRRVMLGRPPYSTKISHAIRCYMFQLIEEIKDVRRTTNVTENVSAPRVQRP
jgi:hypothetical protein